MKILDYINKQTNNAYKDFKLVSVIFDKNLRECTFKFLYKNELKENDKCTLQKLIKDYLPQDVGVVIKCKKAYVDCELVRDVLYNFVTKHYSSVASDFEKEDITVTIDNTINATINCNDFNYIHLSDPNVYKDILDYANSFFFEPFYLDIKSNKWSSDEEIVLENPFENEIYLGNNNIIKCYKVEDIQNIINEVNGNPIDISVIQDAMESAEISGNIRFLNTREFESKRLDKDGNKIIKTLFSFLLTDGTGKINCVVFPNKADTAKMLGFKEGDYVIVHGNVEEYNGRLSMKVSAIAYCKKAEAEVVSEDVEIKKEPNKEYLCCKPEPYTQLSQANLFSTGDEIGDYLMQNDVVVFDIETTGLEVSRCEIIEIGAVKLHQGKKVETFETFVHPENHIPEEITNLTGINDEMVKDAPCIQKVIADFYKFCYNSTIIAYNIDFDYKFVNQFGKRNGYIFDNKQIDALYMARAFVPGLKNFKLGTVCKKLGVSLENAHRAVHDAMATADVVIKLNKNLT